MIKISLTKEFLIEEHLNKQKMVSLIARETNWDISTVRQKLISFNIPLHAWDIEKWDTLITKDFLLEHYVLKRKNRNAIAKEFNCNASVIKNRLKKYNIPIRKEELVPSLDKLKSTLTKEFLQEEYINKKIPIYKIGINVGCDGSVIRNLLLKFGLKLRTKKEALAGLRKGTSKSIEWRKNLSSSTKGKPKPKGFGIKISKALKGNKKHTQSVLRAVCASPNNFEKLCLDYLNYTYPSKFIYTGNGDLIIAGHSVDAYCKELNIVALFHGDYFHCNPEMYKADSYHKQMKKTAQEIWNRDNLILEKIKEAGYQVIVIWEKDLKELYKIKGIKNEKTN